MKSRLLCDDNDSNGLPASFNPTDFSSVSQIDEAQRAARELMASVPFVGDGKSGLGGAGEQAEALAMLVQRRFGTTAPTVAAWCAMLAWSEGADAGYQLWTQAFKLVRHPK